MYKRILVSVGIAGVLVFSGAVFVRPVSALTVDDLQAQIKELLAKIATLTQQLNTTQSTTTVSVAASSSVPHRICAILNRNLSQGTTGDDVSGLQEFLRDQGYLSANATGYFGPMTAQAVAGWQTSQGISAVGALGPVSRERIKVWCGGSTTALLASPTSGPAPLTVTFMTSAGINDATPSIDFGDGQQSTMTKGSCIAIAAIVGGQGGIRCSFTAAHTYSQNGTYGAKATSGGSVTVFVGDSISQNGTFNASPTSGTAPLSVNFTYTPPTDDSAQYYVTFGDGSAQIMDRNQIYCIRAPCISPSVASHTYTQNGTYTAMVTRYIACMYTNPRCMIATIPLGSVQITVGGSSFGGAPTISSFSGPTTLPVNTSGTWSIQASDPENGTLTYHITWGDEYNYPAASSAMAADAFVQTTAFTHAYSRAGTYTVSIVVHDTAGNEAISSSTVRVGAGDVVCTADYTPVCGRPAGCSNSCPPGAYCTMMCRLYEPVTYSNRCSLNAASAEYLYAGTCTGNAY